MFFDFRFLTFSLTHAHTVESLARRIAFEAARCSGHPRPDIYERERYHHHIPEAVGVFLLIINPYKDVSRDIRSSLQNARFEYFALMQAPR